MEDLEYAALLRLSTIRPFEVGRKGGKNSRPESLLRIRYPSSRIRQLRQEKEAIDAMISSIKAEIPRLRITEQLPTSTKVPRLKAKIEEVPREF